ncbi:MAG: hypothetical protein M1818_006211 [Claussenomyces sp. TS43310]|nr:MAG: hypothetical protein M1818_006211 [Claussenomyces sp. TS43310]
MSAATEAAANLRGQTPSPLSRTASTSLQAAAAVNAGLQHSESRRSSSSSNTRNRPPSHAGRRRSTVLANLQLNDPNVPSPGEMITENLATSTPHSLAGSPVISTGDPHHLRHSSLGEIHQELEQEQEAQVNRLLQMIRAQQQQLQQLQSASGAPSNPTAVDDTTPTSERSMSFSASQGTTTHGTAGSTAVPRSPTSLMHPRSSFDLARADINRRSRTPSCPTSPRLRSTSISAEGGDAPALAGRDESAFYQAETQMMSVKYPSSIRMRQSPTSLRIIQTSLGRSLFQKKNHLPFFVAPTLVMTDPKIDV